MKTRFTSLVNVKKNTMQKSERVVQDANATLQRASIELKNSYESLDAIQTPHDGTISEFLASRALLDSQRKIIQHNEEWVAYASKEVENAKEKLKQDMIEFEKFKYLEVQEIQAELKKRKIKEAKDLDEIALITHSRKSENRVAS